MVFKNYCELPTPHGRFRLYDTGNEFLRVVTFGDIDALSDIPLLRLHSSCLASEVFDAMDCDCADQLKESMKVMAHEGNGIIIHLHQEGRGHGLSKKIEAVYKMQVEKLDTVESFEIMGLEQDIRDYSSAIDVLNKLHITKVRLISNNPIKRQALERSDIAVETVKTNPQIRPENSNYLKTKMKKLGHNIQVEAGSDNVDGSIYFYHSDQTWGAFSNFSQHSIYLQGKIWRTSEHFYQSQKFSDPELQEQIRSEISPLLAKQTANEIIKKHHRLSNWSTLKDDVMQQALYAKFSQHPDLRELLLSTQKRHLFEHTANDNYWGDGGIGGSGLNRLGELLMELRKQLQTSERK